MDSVTGVCVCVCVRVTAINTLLIFWCAFTCCSHNYTWTSLYFKSQYSLQICERRCTGFIPYMMANFYNFFQLMWQVLINWVWPHEWQHSFCHSLLLHRRHSAQSCSVFHYRRLITFMLYAITLSFTITYTYFMLPNNVCILLKITFHVFHGLEDTLYLSYRYSVPSCNQIYKLYTENGFGN
jgi:hypothetical protein